MNIILVNSETGADYLADLFISSILTWNGAKVYTNYIPEYIYDDYLGRDSLYGRGYTAFCATPARIRQSGRLSLMDKTSLVNLVDISERKDFSVVFTSIWRCHYGIDSYLKPWRLSRLQRLVVLDGEDHQMLHPSASLQVQYYKRELDTNAYKAKPISFCVPPYSLPFLARGVGFLPTKTNILASCDPRYRNSYIFSTQESYYKQYATSLFAVTTKKGGWDCLRHYEILANHCLPYFPDIADKPSQTMAFYPIELQIRANSLYERAMYSSGPLDDIFWLDYRSILAGFLRYFYTRCLSHAYREILM